MLRRIVSVIGEILRRYLVAGIVFFAPIGITIWAIFWIIQRLDNLLLPQVLRLAGLEDPPRLPILGALFTLFVILLLGVIARHLFGAEFLRAWERLLGRVPVARSIYSAFKQLFEAIFSPGQASRFNRVVLLEYPRKGIWALAFTTGVARGPVQDATHERMVNCFLPTTPNPTSGFYLLVPEKEVLDVELTVEDAFKLVMSAGLVTPESTREAPPEGVAVGGADPPLQGLRGAATEPDSR